MGKELWDAAPCPKEPPTVLVPGRTFWGLWVKTANQGEMPELLTRALSPCFRKRLFARINKFLWLMSCTKLGLGEDFFSGYHKSRNVSAPSSPFYLIFLPSPVPQHLPKQFLTHGVPPAL